jgi:hypothetical protein
MIKYIYFEYIYFENIYLFIYKMYSQYFPKLINLQEDIPLTDFQIKYALRQNCQIYTYDQLKNIGSDLFAKNNYVIILYQIGSLYSGHWVSIYKNEVTKTLIYFDSYGYPPDHAIGLSRSLNKNDRGRLVGLLNNYLMSNYTLDKNIYKFQLYKDSENNISTCGRWCIVRYFFIHLSNKKFEEMITKAIKDNNYSSADELITVMTLLYTM